MTVPANLNRVDYTGTGSAGPFTVPFPFYDASHLTVLQTDALFNQTTLTGWTATGAGGPSGAVTLAAACPVGTTLTIMRLVPLTQITSIKNQEAFYPEVHEQEMDLLAMADQQLDEAMDRTLRLPAGLSGVDMTLPKPDPGHALVWNAGGTALENAGVASATLQQDLADSADVAKGAALVGYKDRTVADELGDRVDVKSFGAVGDADEEGTGTDDTVAINAAIASLSTSGGIVYFPPGRYKITSKITLTKGIHLVGSGQAHVDVLHSLYTRSIPSTILKFGTCDGIQTEDGCSLQNISIEGAYDRTGHVFLNTGHGIILIGQSARLVDVSVSTHNGDGVIIGARTDLADTNFWNLTRVLSVGNNGRGFIFDNTNTLHPTRTNNNAGLCSGCYAWMNGGDGFYIKSTYGNTFSECYSEENGNLLQLGVSTPAHGYHVGGSLALFNTFIGCSGEINTTSLFTMDVGSYNNSVIGSVYGYQPIDNGHNSWIVCQGGEVNRPGMSVKGFVRAGRNTDKTSGPGAIGAEIESTNGFGAHGERPGFYWLDLRATTNAGSKFFEAQADQGVLYFSQYNSVTAARQYWMTVTAAANRARNKARVSFPGTYADVYMPDLENYATNAAAITGGLSVGQLYRNGGVVMVVT